MSQMRESKVRRAGIGGRARLAGELRDMDDEVSHVTKCYLGCCLLAVHQSRTGSRMHQCCTGAPLVHWA